MAAFWAVRRYLGVEALHEPHILLDVGCGVTPRTAALFAFLTKWNCCAIDPLLRPGKWSIDADRLRGFTMKIEEIPLPFLGDTVIATCVHSHAPLEEIVDCVEARRLIIVALPCCTVLELDGIKPVSEYEDWRIHSPQRTVKIFDLEGRNV